MYCKINLSFLHKQSRCIIKFNYRPSLPLQIFHWAVISIFLFISFVFQMEYTYLNWPTVAFLIVFIVLSFIEATRYSMVINTDEEKITKYSLYQWVTKEEVFSNLAEVVFYQKYMIIKFKDDSWCLYFKKEDLSSLKSFFKSQKIKIIESKQNKVFDQFFEQK
ncbi:EbsA family protein [Xylocopilactobacillus apis]|nr:EbsA family protein [Xylocopilactobacillus apis]